MTPHQMAEQIVEREGGFVNHSADKGGPTKYGVSLNLLRRIEHGDINDDGVIDKADIRAVTQDQAVEIFLELFYEKPGLDTLPNSIQAQLFDMAVHHGPSTAIKMLQETLNRLHDVMRLLDQPRATDGVIGPGTQHGCERAIQILGSVSLNAAIAERRKDYFRAIIDNDPSQSVFLNGWIKRAERFNQL